MAPSPSLQAAILAIGDELTQGHACDTNSAWLSRQLLAHSILVAEHRTVADDRIMLATTIRTLAEQYDLLIMTGGLGPTQDDLTREALGDVFNSGKPLVDDTEATGDLVEWFKNRGLAMPESNNRQTLRPAAMRMMPNAHGTAPGLTGRLGDCQIFTLPGPPGEMRPMFENHVLPHISDVQPNHVINIAEIYEYGMGEAEAVQRLGKLADRNQEPLISTTASDAIITARIRAQGTLNVASQACHEIAETIERTWEPYSFGRDGITLSEAVGHLLRDQQLTLVTAESCTGGWLSKTIVDVPGSSDYFLGGWNTYANAMKQTCLQVPEELLLQHGAVSREVARTMAEGALHAGQADLAVSITGIAGPGGGTPDKPVGTVFIAVAQHQGSGPAFVVVRQFRFLTERTVVRDRAVKSALQMLRFTILNVTEDIPLLWQV